jgi:coenzyme F420-reducing hydrogenase delta subunit
MILDHFTHERLLDQVETLMGEAAASASEEPRILFLSCNWCFPLDEGLLEGLPAGVRTMDVLCTGRIHPALIMHAYEHGADGVFVAGCVEGECHYKSGNQVFMPQAGRLRGVLKLLGVAPERFHLALLPRGHHMELPKTLAEFGQTLAGIGHLDAGGKADEIVEVSS